jgi:chloramphenicol O-acetyltransferase type A
MYKPIDFENWNRREHFEFFSGFDEPFFGINCEVDCTLAYRSAREAGVSFFLWYLYQSLRAANEIEQFRYRIMDDQVVCYDRINASATINRDDNTFGFSFIEYQENEANFRKAADIEIAAVRSTSGLRMTGETERIDTIHYSALPWFRFTGLTHARQFATPDSAPKISFGKFTEVGEKLMMPVAIFVHHGLMDASHVAQHLDVFQDLLNS